ncbi:MAG TPA: aminopeptidase P family protein [Clostridia bacterium]|nr:aminopeptidase P family protein [Clostridia bacterium]
MIDERLARLRALMEERGLAAYYVPTDDCHLSEYVGEYFRARAYMTGFTGSAGTLVVTPGEACLWVDSRYFLQSEFQTAGSSIKVMRVGEEGVPSIAQYLLNTLPEGARLGFDGRTVGAQWALRTGRQLASKKITLEPTIDLVGEIWENRPPLPVGRVFVLSEEYAGRSAEDKLADVRRAMKEKDADAHVLATLDDIAWLLNIRGDDVLNTPVALSYLVVEAEEAFLFIDGAKLDEDAREHLRSLNVTVRPYGSVYEFAARYIEGSTVMLWSERVNFALYDIIAKEATVVDAENPTYLAKAVKNETEVENLRRAHIKDGLALTRFIKWAKENVGRIEMDEISAADKLDEARRALPGNLGLSFNTICAYGPHAALPHYSATPETNVNIEPSGFLLVDSGGQYYEGTTDVTRTFAVGELTREQKRNFALVLRGMLALAGARFLYGCRGANLDALCRAPLWEAALDYKHGTGHGVGYLLGVHEGPNSFRWKIEGEKPTSCVLEEGMVTSDEPGLYFESAYGIRTENLVVCRRDVKNEYGQFMRFETLTCAPIDLDAVDPALLNEAERKQLNCYHAFVFEKLAPLMDREEREWLRKYTRSI